MRNLHSPLKSTLWNTPHHLLPQEYMDLLEWICCVMYYICLFQWSAGETKKLIKISDVRPDSFQPSNTRRKILPLLLKEAAITTKAMTKKKVSQQE